MRDMLVVLYLRLPSRNASKVPSSVYTMERGVHFLVGQVGSLLEDGSCVGTQYTLLPFFVHLVHRYVTYWYPNSWLLRWSVE